MNQWEHLFLSEYAERRTLLAGLTLEQVNRKVSPQAHTIFEELWHTVLWQKILVTRDETLYEQTWKRGELYPERLAQSSGEWDALVEDFFTGMTGALDWTATPERLTLETDPGSSMADVLRGLAVHNAYHLGKIVALRQVMGLWPA